MVTGLSSPMRIMSNDDREEKRRGLVTRDLLGGCDTAPSASGEFDLNLLSGSAYLESRQLQDLNLPPPPPASPALQLGLAAPSRPSPLSYQSVCTLDKVRFALERAERESRKQRSDGTAVSPSSSTTTTTSSVKRRGGAGAAGEGDEGEDVSFESSSSGAGAAMMAAGCPKCLMYVLISKGNPTCPRCGSHVPVMVLESSKKRPRIDLNSSEQILI